MAMKMRFAGRVFALLAVGVIIASGADTQAQGISAGSFQNWNFLGAGARARAMGGAFLGVSNDGSAATWNPAGLIYNEGVSLTANYTALRVDLGLDHAPVSPNASTLNASDDANLSNLSSATFLAPLTLREHEFFMSAFYHRLQDVYAQGQFLTDDVNLPTQLGTPFSTDYALSGNFAVVGAGFGTVVYQNWTVGGTLGLITGDGTESHNMSLDSTRYSEANPLADATDYVLWEDRSDLNYSGIAFTLGAMYKAERWTAGMVFTPGYTITENLDYFGTRTTITDGVPKPLLGIVPGPDGTNRELSIPYSVGLGGSYQATEKLLVAGDYQYRAFKDHGEIAFEDDPVVPDSPLDVMPTKFYNLHQVRLGAEYMAETDWGLIPIRVGVRNEPMLIGDQEGVIVTYDQRAGNSTRPGGLLTPRDDYFLSVSTPGAIGDQINPITFTIGSGVHWSQIHLDFSLEYLGYDYTESGTIMMVRRCDDCDPNDPRFSIDEWGGRFTSEFGRYTRTYEDSRMRFSLNFTGYF